MSHSSLRSFGKILAGIFLACSMSMSWSADQPTVSASAEAGTKPHNGALLQKIIEGIGTKSKTLLIDAGTWNIDSSLTIPANITLRLEGDAAFQLASAAIFTIDGPLEAAPLRQIFFGKGHTRFGPGYLGEAFPQWWGKISGVDDTAMCQAALDSRARTIRFPAGEYLIDAVGDARENGRGLLPNSDSVLIFEPGAVLRAIPTAKDDYTVLQIINVKNVLINGVTIVGERNQHLGTGGEWGHGIRIMGTSSNIRIKNASVSECWGDGIYLGGGIPDGITVENSRFHHHRRNACSIISARNVVFRQCSFSASDATSPFKGVDIEPNVPSDVLHNIVFEDCYSFDNVSQGFSLARDDRQDHPVSVTFRGCVSENDGGGFNMDVGPSDCWGILYITNCTVVNPKETGFRCSSGNLQMKISGLYIINPNRKSEPRPMFGSGIVIVSSVPQHAGKAKMVGNIDAEGIYVYSDDDKPIYALYLENSIAEKGGIKNLDISLKTNLPAEKRFWKGAGPYAGFCKIVFPDDPTVGATENFPPRKMAAFVDQTLTNDGSKKGVTLSLDRDSAKLGSTYTILVAEPHKISIETNGTDLLPRKMKRYASAEVGSRLKIRSDGTNWFVVEQVGSWDTE